MWFYTDRQVKHAEKPAENNYDEIRVGYNEEEQLWNEESQTKHIQSQKTPAAGDMRQSAEVMESSFSQASNNDVVRGYDVEYVKNLFGTREEKAPKEKISQNFEQTRAQYYQQDYTNNRDSSSVLPLMDKQGWWEKK